MTRVAKSGEPPTGSGTVNPEGEGRGISRAPDGHGQPTVVVDFCGEKFEVKSGESLTIGREADVTIDDNPFLHRVFLLIDDRDGIWFIHNVGSQLGATVADATGRMEAFLSPGAALPLVFGDTSVVFTAGPTTYDLQIQAQHSLYTPPVIESVDVGEATAGQVPLTVEQRLLILALAEPRLKRGSGGATTLPSSPQAAKRLGWSSTKFNRKLDNVCDKLAKAGVRGLQGDVASYASNRRSRLVEYAVATRLVSVSDLRYLDAHIARIVAEDGEPPS